VVDELARGVLAKVYFGAALNPLELEVVREVVLKRQPAEPKLFCAEQSEAHF